MTGWSSSRAVRDGDRMGGKTGGQAWAGTSPSKGNRRTASPRVGASE
jgi:hypothetical protein